MPQVDSLTGVEARTVLEALKRGGVPYGHTELLAVGRNHWLSSIEEDLGFISSGGAKSRIIVAPYGGGKTHFLTLVSNKALAENFAVSFVELHSRESPFDRFETIFGKVMRQIKTKDRIAGVQHILDTWSAEFPYYSAKETEEALRDISKSLDFRSALRSYLELSTISSSSSLEQKQDIVAWLQGDRLPSSVMKKLGIRNRITITNVAEVFTSFLEFLHAAGYSGLVLLLDEAEAITSLTQSKRREEANQNLRKLLDNTDRNRRFYLLFATTERFIEDPNRGARSYPALWDRIRSVLAFPSVLASKRSIIINLEPLAKEDSLELAENIVQIHAIAWNWTASMAVTNQVLDNYWERYSEAIPNGPIRPFLRTLIDMLDVAQQLNGTLDLDELMESMSFGDLEI